MAFIPIPNCVKAELRLSWDNQEVENVFHFITPAQPTAGDLAAVAEGVEDWWMTNIRPQVPSTVVYREVYATDQTSATGGAFTASGASNSPGTDTGVSVPNNVTIAITLRTGQRGRSYRGRAFHVGLQESQVTNNAVASSTVTVLQTAYSQLMQSANFGGCILGVASRFQNNAPRLVGVCTEVTSVVVADNIVDSQRRRLPGRGR
jgi:hypothetical protein